ncbi:MAG: DUF1059 domain-containing protein [Candidatus Micrarchaeota archaeon]|nr:DUF1059 domain-containing protein [Candidatus Micrarchaeota archaeon]MDE1846502.1 DUF1059 domain-containing protein [Candidatus Micrarchaeota archaeon]
MKKFVCRDIGFACDFTAEGATVEELMPKIADHARVAHNMAQLDDATKAKVSAAIKDA